jgi:hypothetical protein
LRALAKDILGISEFMFGFIEFDGAATYDEPPLLGGSVVPA